MTTGPSDESGVPDHEIEPTLERIEADVEHIAHDMPVEFRRLIELLRRQRFSGPLPPPEILEGYKAAYPDAPRIVFDELVKQGNHRRGIEAKAIDRQETRADRGQTFALIIVLAVLVVTVISLAYGQGWVGAALFGTTLVGIVSLFIYGNRRQLDDLLGKRQRLDRTLPRPEPPEQPASDEDGPSSD